MVRSNLQLSYFLSYFLEKIMTSKLNYIKMSIANPVLATFGSLNISKENSVFLCSGCLVFMNFSTKYPYTGRCIYMCLTFLWSLALLCKHQYWNVIGFKFLYIRGLFNKNRSLLLACPFDNLLNWILTGLNETL